MASRDKVILTAALAGGTTTKRNNPNTPYTPEEFAEEAYRCWNEGCSIVHIHAKDPKTGASELFMSRFNHHARVQGGVLAEECGAALKAFFAARR